MSAISFGCKASQDIFLGQKTDDELRGIYSRCREVIKHHNGGNLPVDYDRQVLAAASKNLSQDLQWFGKKKMGRLNRISVACTARVLGKALDVAADYAVVYTSPETEMWDPMASTIAYHTSRDVWIETMAYCLACKPEWVEKSGWV